MLALRQPTQTVFLNLGLSPASRDALRIDKPMVAHCCNNAVQPVLPRPSSRSLSVRIAVQHLYLQQMEIKRQMPCAFITRVVKTAASPIVRRGELNRNPFVTLEMKLVHVRRGRARNNFWSAAQDGCFAPSRIYCRYFRRDHVVASLHYITVSDSSRSAVRTFCCHCVIPDLWRLGDGARSSGVNEDSLGNGQGLDLKLHKILRSHYSHIAPEN